jgi:hypothetical protein
MARNPGDMHLFYFPANLHITLKVAYRLNCKQQIAQCDLVNHKIWANTVGRSEFAEFAGGKTKPVVYYLM